MELNSLEAKLKLELQTWFLRSGTSVPDFFSRPRRRREENRFSLRPCGPENKCRSPEGAKEIPIALSPLRGFGICSQVLRLGDEEFFNNLDW
jgi:hypothetical protein